MLQKEQLKRHLETQILKQGQFLVALDIKAANSTRPRLEVVVDSDNGITIDEVTSISRQLGAFIEGADTSDSPFVLEVGSPGADQPLVLQRQYPRHIGRVLSLELRDGQALKGKLTAVGESEIQLEAKALDKGRKTERTIVTIPFEDIKSSKVIISFK